MQITDKMINIVLAITAAGLLAAIVASVIRGM